MKKFINDPFDVVDEMLEGFLAIHGRHVRRLDTARTVVRVDAPVQNKVGVVTGGGSGHKPAFIGFVGKGMLDAVAVGEIFTSPPPNAVFDRLIRIGERVEKEGRLPLEGGAVRPISESQLKKAAARVIPHPL